LWGFLGGLQGVWFGVHCGLEFAHALALEFDLVGVVDDAWSALFWPASKPSSLIEGA
jgi:hypothetical protein